MIIIITTIINPIQITSLSENRLSTLLSLSLSLFLSCYTYSCYLLVVIIIIIVIIYYDDGRISQFRGDNILTHTLTQVIKDSTYNNIENIQLYYLLFFNKNGKYKMCNILRKLVFVLSDRISSSLQICILLLYYFIIRLSIEHWALRKYILMNHMNNELWIMMKEERGKNKQETISVHTQYRFPNSQGKCGIENQNSIYDVFLK